MSGDRPGLFRSAWSVAAKDLRLEWRTFDSLAAMLLFAMVLLLIFAFAFGATGAGEIEPEKLVPGVLWSAVSFTSLIAFSRSFQTEERQETMVALLHTPLDPSALFAGKLLANLCLVAVVEAALLPLSAIFFSLDLRPVLGSLLPILVLHTFGLGVLGTLAGAIATRLQRGEALVAVILLPLASPLLISAIECTGTVVAGRGLGSLGAWIWGTVAFDVLFLSIGLLTFEFVVER